MSQVRKVTDTRTNTIIHGAKHIFRLRRNYEDSLVGASKADRRFLKGGIAMLDRIISLHLELNEAVGLADWKPHRRVTHSARARR